MHQLSSVSAVEHEDGASCLDLPHIRGQWHPAERLDCEPAHIFRHNRHPAQFEEPRRRTQDPTPALPFNTARQNAKRQSLTEPAS